jgi:AcrR family transcriptional regulator
VEAAGADRTLRADAARNRERILVAAGEVFSEQGLDASVAEIAKRACVGKATIFRSYPSKEHLIAAVSCERVRWVEDLAVTALDQDDAWAAFTQLITELAEHHACDLSHVGALTHTAGFPRLDQAKARANAALSRLMERAKEQGEMRPDATPDDIRVMFKGVTAAMTDAERRDVEVWRRWAELFVNAFRADPALP